MLMLTDDEILERLPTRIAVEGFLSRNAVTVNGEDLDLAGSLKVRDHSPTGFSWGYDGSGPSQFALALLLKYLDTESAVMLYKLVRFYWISKLPQRDFRVIVNLRSIVEQILIAEKPGHV